MPDVSLSRLEKLTGIRAHTFRTWEQRYALLKNMRQATGWRTYTVAQTRLLLNIALLNSAGYKISDIARLNVRAIAEKAATLAAGPLKRQQAIHSLFLHMLTLEAEDFEMVLNSCMQYWGASETVTGVLMPFLEKTGLLHQPHPSAAETLVQNIIRHKLVAAIEQLPALREGQGAALLFLPPRHYHSEALLCMQYLLKQQGLSAYCVGTHVPPEHIKTIALSGKFSYFYTCCAQRGGSEALAEVADCLQHKLGAQLFVLSNAGDDGFAAAAPGVVVFHSIYDAYNLLPQTGLPPAESYNGASVAPLAGGYARMGI